MNFRELTCTALTLLAALAAAQLCIALRTPIPWMLGPLLVTAVASVFGVPTRSSNLLRNGGQWVIGVALGLYFTPQVSALVVSLWWAVALTAVWALGLGALFGLWLERQHAADFVHLPPGAWRATSYFASAIGGASEMTMLAERHGARTDLVAAAHSLRRGPTNTRRRCELRFARRGVALEANRACWSTHNCARVDAVPPTSGFVHGM
jgi:membrane AbrB-like protein